MNALRRAAEDAIAPEHIAAIMRRAARMALEGNMSAMRLVLERACGRAVDAPPHPLTMDVALPPLTTAGNCALAIDRLVEAIHEGTVDRDAAKVLLDVIRTRIAAIELTEMEARIVELETAAAEEDPRFRSNGRRS